MKDLRLIEVINRSDRRLNIAQNSLYALILLSAFVLGFCEMRPAEADEKQVERQETVYRLSQCIIAECDHCETNPRERDAIGWCLKKQARVLKRTLLKQTINYCAYTKRKTPRARAIYNSTFLKPLHGIPGKELRLWRNTRTWAESFYDNPPPDPEPRADQWGGDMDIPRAKRLGLKYIAGPPEYANTFWRSKLFAKLERRRSGKDSRNPR